MATFTFEIEIEDPVTRELIDELKDTLRPYGEVVSLSRHPIPPKADPDPNPLTDLFDALSPATRADVAQAHADHEDRIAALERAMDVTLAHLQQTTESVTEVAKALREEIEVRP